MDETYSSLEELLDDTLDADQGGSLFQKSSYYDMNDYIDFVNKTDHDEMFTIFNANARSFLKHQYEFIAFLDAINTGCKFSFDVLSFDETWLNDPIQDAVKYLFDLQGKVDIDYCGEIISQGFQVLS